MEIYEIKQNVEIKRDIKQVDIQFMTASFVDYALVTDATYRKMHVATDFKPYIVGLMLPLEKDGVYKAGNIYSFVVRTNDKNLCTFLVKTMAFFKGFDAMFGEGLTFNKLKVNENNLTVKTTTATDVDFTVQGIKVINRNDPEKAKQYIERNIKAKYLSFYKEELTSDFIEKVEIIGYLNTTLKDCVFTCDRYEITFKDTVEGRKARDLVLVLGAGLKNARGFGFCIQKTDKPAKVS